MVVPCWECDDFVSASLLFATVRFGKALLSCYFAWRLT